MEIESNTELNQLQRNNSKKIFTESSFSPTKITKSTSSLNKVPHQPSEDYQQNSNFYKTAFSQDEGDCTIEKIYPMKISISKTVLGIILAILSLGTVLFALQIFKQIYLHIFYEICEIKQATHFLIQNSDKRYTFQKCLILKDLQGLQQIGFKNRFLTYYYKQTENVFQSILFDIDLKTNKQIQNMDIINNNNDRQKSQLLFGLCTIDFPLPTYLGFLKEFLTKPIMYLNYVAIIVWFFEQFYMYVVAQTFGMTVVSILLYCFLKSSQQRILQMAKHIIPINRVIKKSLTNDDQFEFQKIQSDQLIPGDLITIEPQQTLPCDVILLKGEVFVNESGLTGESDPISKSSLLQNDNYFCYSKNSHNLIYEGSQILQSNSEEPQFQQAIGIVIRTGFSTKKGQIVRYSLFPKIKIEEFLISLFKFCSVTMFLAILSWAIMYPFLEDNETLTTNLKLLKLGEAVASFSASNLVIQIPAIMVVAMYRLKKKNIIALHPFTNLTSGTIETVCFDKTGTVTNLSVQAMGIWTPETDFVQNKNIVYNTSNLQILQNVFSTCHSAKNYQGQIQGDSVDVQMFNLSKNTIIQDNQNKYLKIKNEQQNQEIQVLHRFDFKSEHASMSVITHINNFYYTFTKGSPEKIKSFCDQSSIPNNYDESLNQYASKGLRIIALAYQKFEDLSQIKQGLTNEGQGFENLDRNDIEKNLVFLGFLILENNLKPDSTQVLTNLQNANLHCKLISGDNMQTVLQTGIKLNFYENFNDQNLQFGLIDYNNNQDLTLQFQQITSNQSYQENITYKNNEVLEQITNSQSKQKVKQIQFACTGNGFQYLLKQWESQQNQSEIKKQFINNCKIFARCTPNNKQQIIQEIKKLNIKVAMVGDGSNDCLAIQEADIGVSFSKADAAFSSPFCTLDDSVSCIEKIILQGRACLEIGIESALFYMTCTFIKYVGHLVLINYNQTPGDFQATFTSFMFGYVIPCFAYALSAPTEILRKKTLQTSMTSLRSIVSTTFRYSIILISYFICHYLMKNQSFYNKQLSDLEEDGSLVKKGIQNTVDFLCYNIICAFQPIIQYRGGDVKKHVFNNFILFFTIIVNMIVSILLFIVGDDFPLKALKLVEINQGFRIIILIIMLVSISIQLWFEKFIITLFFLYKKQKK